ncbi:T9SS type A sorting domain-containing protein [bacterium]|nr:T9SS type A sorting domain-containing protein [bacterium]
MRSFKRCAYYYLLLMSFSFLQSQQAFSQWSKVEGGGLPAFEWSLAMDVCDKNTVILNIYTDSEKYFQTTDNGGTWVEIPFLPGETHGGSDISMIDRDHIWVIGAGRKIYTTEDRGVNWVCQFDDESLTHYLNYIQMFDLGNGVAMGDAPSGDAPVILKTTDGGQNWISVNQQAIGRYSYNEWRCVSFPTMDVGYFRAPNAKIWKTVDGGVTWMDTGRLGSDIVKFYDANFGLFSMIHGFGRTVDGLVTVVDSIPGFYHRTDFEFAPGTPSNVWVAGSNELYFSGDSGRTFVLQMEISPTGDGALNNVEFADSAHGFILCSRALYKTRNGGGIYTEVQSDELDLPRAFSLDQNYPNPFNGETRIPYTLSARANITMTIVDLRGRTVSVLEQGLKSAGRHEAVWNAAGVRSGVYLAQLRVGSEVRVRKVAVVK